MSVKLSPGDPPAGWIRDAAMFGYGLAIVAFWEAYEFHESNEGRQPSQRLANFMVRQQKAFEDWVESRDGKNILAQFPGIMERTAERVFPGIGRAWAPGFPGFEPKP